MIRTTAQTKNSEIDVVSMDYCWMTETRQERLQRKANQHTDTNMTHRAGLPILVMKSRNTQVVVASVVPAKGATPFSVSVVTKFLKFLGERKVILKSDQENSSMALKDAVIAHSEYSVSTEESPVGEHASNGAVEQAVQRVQGQARVLKEAPEARCRTRPEPTHSCWP